MLELLFGAVALLVVVASAVVVVRINLLVKGQQEALAQVREEQEIRHRSMLNDLHDGLGRQTEQMGLSMGASQERLRSSLLDTSERLRLAISESFERLRTSVSQELKETRDAMQALQLSQAESAAQTREHVLKQLADISTQLVERQTQLREEVLARLSTMLAEQAKAEQEMLQNTLRNTTQQLTGSIGELTLKVESRLDILSGKVNERLDEGFKKTNETFASVMARLATIDEAQKKIDGLTTNVVSLQELLGDKRSRGAFGEVQLEHLVRNILPVQVFELQSTLSNGTRVDCLLRLPEPTGSVAVDAKFPLENYHRMFEAGELERTAAQRAFRADVKKHIDDIASKYIVPGETADGAVMFVPAEAVFAEIHAYHAELVQYALAKRVWIVSPTTMMAVLNTARAVIKDVETRRQVHIIKDALSKLGKEFERFDQRMKKLADHIRMAHEDAQQVQITSDKISRRFTEIEHVRLDSAVEEDQSQLEKL